MFHRTRPILAMAILLLAPAPGHASLATYTQNFETLTASDPAALSNNGWLVYGNVYTPAHVFLYGYGAFPAPNGGTAFCSVATGQGGAQQGAQQLSVYNDYNNTDHANGNLVEANVYQQQTIAATDVRTTWTFQFDAKLGNLVSPSTAIAFIKTIDPTHSYAQTNFITLDMTAIPATWNTYTISITLDPALSGQLMQFGFNSTASHYIGSGVFYDNITWQKTAAAGVGEPQAGALELRPAAPNPFQNSTRLDYTLPRQGVADVSVFDVEGRRMATLFHGLASAGAHVATWDGHLADGRLAPAGIYRSVLQTDAGRMTRSLVLAR